MRDHVLAKTTTTPWIKMFNFGRKKSDLEKQIEKEGMEYASDRVADLVSNEIPNEYIAYRFVLEELDGASGGNDESKSWARNSGISAAEYRDALENSIPEVDGPGGPQQMLFGFGLELAGNPPMMTEFRRTVADKIMRRYRFGKYSEPESLVPEFGGALLATDEKIKEIADQVDGLTSELLSLLGVRLEKSYIQSCVRRLASDEEMFAATESRVLSLEVVRALAHEKDNERDADYALAFALSLLKGVYEKFEPVSTLDERAIALVIDFDRDALEIINKYKYSAENHVIIRAMEALTGGKGGEENSKPERMNDEFITPDNLSRQLLKSIFDAAFMDASYDKDGDLKVKEEIVCYVFPGEDLIKLVTGVMLKNESTKFQRLRAMNEINRNYLITKVWVGERGMQFEWDIPINGGITKKALVLAVKRFCTIPREAARAHAIDVVQ